MEAGTTTLDGILEVEDARIVQGRVEVVGVRMMAYYVGEHADPRMVTIQERVKIVVDADGQAWTDASVQAALSAVFHPSDYLQTVKTDYWKRTARGEKELDMAKKANTPIGTLPGGRPVYLTDGKAIKPPKLLRSTDPEYTDLARQQKIEGRSFWKVVLNEEGVPEVLILETPLEPSLDASAAASLRRWRFRPAALNGKAIGVLIDTQFSFTLH